MAISKRKKSDKDVYAGVGLMTGEVGELCISFSIADPDDVYRFVVSDSEAANLARMIDAVLA